MVKRVLLIALLIVGLAASSFVVGQRARVESRNKAVDLVLEYAEIEQLSAATGRSVTDILRDFKGAGATSVAITEQTMRDAIQNRSVAAAGARRYAAGRAEAQRIANHLRMVIPGGKDRISYVPSGDDSYGWIVVSGVPAAYLDQLPIGLPQEAVDNVKAAGMEIVGRLVNYVGASPKAISQSLNSVRALGVKKIIFSGDQVLGYKGAVEDTAFAFRKNGLIFGMIEFSRQKGELTLADKADGNVIVVHSVNSNEMYTMSQPAVVERFQKAVRERGARLLYAHIYDTASADVVESNVDYIGDIARGVCSAGYKLKNSHPLDQIEVPVWMRAAAGVGAAAGAVALLAAVVDLSVGAFLLWLIPVTIACAGLAAYGDIGRKMVALLAAIAFPTLAVLIAARAAPEKPTPTIRPLRRAVLRMLGAIATAAAGGVIIVGLLSSRDFMLRIDQFAGVKAAHLLPILILALLYAATIGWRRERWAAQKRKVREAWETTAGNPVLMWQLGLAAVLLVVVGLMVARSGNEGLQVSGLELKFRSVLDRVMLVRPRTKEFLLGYPALLTGIAFALRGRRSVAAPLLVLGAIGLVSALNTFCHIHTPLAISGLRVVNGAVVGTLIGLVAYAIVRHIPGKEK